MGVSPRLNWCVDSNHCVGPAPMGISQWKWPHLLRTLPCQRAPRIIWGDHIRRHAPATNMCQTPNEGHSEVECLGHHHKVELHPAHTCALSSTREHPATSISRGTGRSLVSCRPRGRWWSIGGDGSSEVAKQLSFGKFVMVMVVIEIVA